MQAGGTCLHLCQWEQQQKKAASQETGCSTPSRTTKSEASLCMQGCRESELSLNSQWIVEGFLHALLLWVCELCRLSMTIRSMTTSTVCSRQSLWDAHQGDDVCCYFLEVLSIFYQQYWYMLVHTGLPYSITCTVLSTTMLMWLVFVSAHICDQISGVYWGLCHLPHC